MNDEIPEKSPDELPDGIDSGDEVFGAESHPLVLLDLLRRHLDKDLENSVDLSDEQVLLVKSWLLTHAEGMSPGKAMWLEETEDGVMTKLVAAIGRDDAGDCILWHEPLPWPFPFAKESHRIDGTELD